MDIEGGELRAIHGMHAVIGRASDDLTMFVECNPGALRAARGSASGLVGRLSSLEFEVKIIDERNQRLVSVGPDIEALKSVNLYCTRKRGGLH
jgi:hypothetical protein